MKKEDRRGILFAGTVLLWSWAVLSVPIMLRLPFGNIVTQIAYILAGASPSVIALLFVRVTDAASMRAFVRRIWEPRRITVGGYAFILLFIPAVFAVSLCAQAWLSMRQPDWTALGRYAHNPLGLLLFAVFTLLFGPVAEEIGWRGYLLDQFAKRGLPAYGLAIGVLWALWHLPMFFIAGTYQNGLLAGGALPVLRFALATTATGVLIGRLVIKNNGSILAAVLFHFMVNFTGELIPLDAPGNTVKAALLVATACGALILDRTTVRKGASSQYETK